MFVAYLVPKHDSHLVFEDGLGYIASGATEAEALAALRAQFDESMPCDDAEQIAEREEIWANENRAHVAKL